MSALQLRSGSFWRRLILHRVQVLRLRCPDPQLASVVLDRNLFTAQTSSVTWNRRAESGNRRGVHIAASAPAKSGRGSGPSPQGQRGFSHPGQEFYVTCHPGLENVVADELCSSNIRAQDVVPKRAGVHFRSARAPMHVLIDGANQAYALQHLSNAVQVQKQSGASCWQVSHDPLLTIMSWHFLQCCQFASCRGRDLTVGYRANLWLRSGIRSGSHICRALSWHSI